MLVVASWMDSVSVHIKINSFFQTDDPELNFFDNMKHIQKHRRGRALRRLAKRIESEPDFLSTKCLFEVVYPMTCSYLFNSDYTKHSDTILVWLLLYQTTTYRQTTGSWKLSL